MSVVGLDVGNDTSCVALARKRGVDVLMNKESTRETPSMVSFGDKMRFLGTDAYGKVSMNPKNTPHQLKRLLGKKFADPDVQADIQRFPFKVTAAPDGGCLVHVTFCNEPASFTPEQLMAMLLVDLKKIAEVEGGIPVTDCVLSVPAFYTEAERYAMLNSAFIAGLNPLRLINETTATALAYGIYKTDLPETDPVNVVFIDMGHSSTQVSVVAFKRSGLTVKCHAWDRNLGGRDIDELMYDYFCKEVAAKQKLDIRSLPKASFKLRTAVEKVKKILSANAEAPLNIECIHEDTDVRGQITRDELEEWMAPLLVRVQALLTRTLEGSGLQASDISSVEVVGASTRVPGVFKLVQDTFGMTPSRTLNAKEVVSRGCALACAMLSPVFKVRDYDVVDAVPYAVDFTWDKEGAPTTQTVFDKYSAFPSTKAITFMRSEPFSVTASYAEDATLPASVPRQLGSYTVGPFTVPEGADKAKLKVHLHMNLNGLVTLTSASAITEVEEEVPVTATSGPAADAAAAGAGGGDTPMEEGAAAPAAADGPAPMEAEASPAPAEAAAPPAVEKKKKVVKSSVPVAAAGVCGYTTKQLNDYLEKEGQMAAADKLQEDTNEARNALESYIFELRRRLYEELAPFVQESDRESLSAKLSSMEDWLYEDGEDEKKSVYVSKLGDLKALGDPIEQRAADDAGRAAAVADLRALADGYLALAGSPLPAHVHLGEDDRGTLRKEAGDALSWLNEKVALQAQLHKYDTPLLTLADIKKKRDVLDRVCKPIADKKPPPPPKPAAAPAAAEPAAAAAQPTAEPAPMEAEEGAAAAAAGAGEAMEQ